MSTEEIKFADQVAIAFMETSLKLAADNGVRMDDCLIQEMAEASFDMATTMLRERKIFIKNNY